MFWEVFLKKILAILGKVLIFKVFRVESFFKVFFWISGAWGLWGILGVFLFGLPFPWFPIRVSIHLRFASDDSPLVLRSIFDRSSIPERRSNGERTEIERRINGGWTEIERKTNGERTENERRTNGRWYRKYTVTNVQNKNAKRVLTKKLMKQLMGINGI